MNSRGKCRGAAGLTLIEIMIAVTILVLALLGLFAVILHTTRSNTSQRENLAAMRAAEEKIEELMAYTFDNIINDFGQSNMANPLPDPLPAPADPGSFFDVSLNTLEYYDSKTSSYQTKALNLIAQTGASYVGQISFPVSGKTLHNETGLLDEQETGAFTKMGSNLDLDGNGSTTDTFDPTNPADMANVNIIPVTIEISWEGIKGRQSMTYRHILLRK